MKKISLKILRIGLGITFVWIGILIWMNPTAWGSALQPWATNLVPGSLEQMMLGTAILDMIVGVWLIIGVYTWIPALLGSFHILVVLITTTSGFQNIIVRDIGLLAASLSLFFETKFRK